MKTVLIALIITAIGLQAHDLWINTAGVLHYGHATNAHGTEETVKADEIALRECVGDAASCELLFITLHPKYYTKTPYGTKHEPKNKVKQVVSSKKVFAFAKRIYEPKYYAPLGKGFELSLSKPYANLEVGDKLRVLVSMDGKAIKGVAVAYEDRFVGVSDDEGRVNVKIRHVGLQQLKAALTQKGDGIECDELLYESHLNLEIAP